MKTSTLSISYSLEIKYEIIGYPNYVVVKGGDIYNRKTNRKLKKTVINYTRGVWFGKSFFTKNKLAPLLVKPEHAECPF